MSVPRKISPNGQELELLPRTPEELEEFIESITEEFDLPPGDGTAEAIATAIMHMPSTHAYAPRMVFGHTGLKQMANTAAFAKLEELRRKRDAAKKAAAEEAAKKEAESPAVTVNEQPLQDS